MKSEHRHELKTNELERIASEWGHSVERYLHEKILLLVVAAVAIVVVAGGLVYWRSTWGTADQQGWREFAGAAKIDDYANVADKYAGTPAGAWARLMEGEMELSSGIRSSFSDRAAGRSDLKKAQENFEKLIADKATPKDVLERALFGLARAKEALPDKAANTAKVNDAAIETYQRLLTDFPLTVYKEFAESRIATLRTGSAQDFYAWFEQQNPKPADREIPKDLIPPLPDETKTAPGTPAEKGGKPLDVPHKANGAPGKSTPRTGSAKTAPDKGGAKQAPPQGGPAVPAPSSPAAK